MENKMWNVGSRPIYAYVDEYKDNIKIHLRRFFRDKQGEWKPSLRGIALDPEEWETFKTYIQEIDLEVRKQLTKQVEQRATLPPTAMFKGAHVPVKHVDTTSSFISPSDRGISIFGGNHSLYTP